MSEVILFPLLLKSIHSAQRRSPITSSQYSAPHPLRKYLVVVNSHYYKNLSSSYLFDKGLILTEVLELEGTPRVNCEV